MTDLLAGGHGDQVDPVAEAKARDAGLAQFFLGDPQAWKGPQVAFEGGAAPSARRPRPRASPSTSTPRTC